MHLTERSSQSQFSLDCLVNSSYSAVQQYKNEIHGCVMVTSFPEKKSGFPFKWLVILVVLGIGVYYVPSLFHGGKGGAGPQGGGVPVSVATVISKPITNWSEFSGILQAVNSVEIRPRIGGQIMQIHFSDGAEVKKGQPLFTIDPRPYEAAVTSTKGALTEAQSILARAQKLVKSKAISRAEFEAAQSAYDRALGNYNAAAVNLEYTHITAPISGKISRAEITQGNIVEAGPGAPLMASIVTLSPIYAAFDVDEATFLKTIQGVPANKLKTIPVEVGLGNQQGELTKATIHSFDNQIAPGSGTIRVRATLTNKDATLIPGLYAKVRLGTADQTDAILVNPTAIGTDQSKKFVMVVGAENKVEYREVKLGGISDGLQIITEGLKPGEKIVVTGLQRVQQPGTVIAGKDVDMVTLQGEPEPAPAATDAAATPADAAPADAAKPAEEKPTELPVATPAEPATPAPEVKPDAPADEAKPAEQPTAN